MDVAELAYLGGLLDGEGCIYVSSKKRNYGRGTYFALAVTVSNTDRRVIDWLQARFPGHTRCNQRNGGVAHHKDIYFWSRNSKLAAEFLRAVRPYLIIKGERADLGLELDAMCFSGKQHITDVEYQRMMEIQGEIRAMNKRG